MCYDDQSIYCFYIYWEPPAVFHFVWIQLTIVSYLMNTSKLSWYHQMANRNCSYFSQYQSTVFRISSDCIWTLEWTSKKKKNSKCIFWKTLFFWNFWYFTYHVACLNVWTSNCSVFQKFIWKFFEIHSIEDISITNEYITVFGTALSSLIGYGKFSNHSVDASFKIKCSMHFIYTELNFSRSMQPAHLKK